jgi:HB1, ASXL, restriction endonuclease HTH domain
MTFYEAALQILKSSRKPLTTKEITDRALDRGLIISRGKTPVATMAAVLYKRLGTDLQLVKTEDRGPARAKPGTVRWTLRETRDSAR